MKISGGKLIVIALATWFSVLVLNCAGQNSEPAFAGKTLNAWLQQYRSTGGDPDKIEQNTQAIKAVRSIGTNAIPTLLKMIRAKTSSKFGLSDLNVKGVDGFFILGAAASNAVPELLEIMDENESPSSQASAAHALAGIGPGATVAIPALARLATNSQSKIRSFAFMVLAKISASYNLTMPIATHALNDTNYLVSYSAMDLLGNCGTNAVASIPTLVRVSTNADFRLRRAACVALGKIHSSPGITVPALMARLSDPVAQVRGEAAWDLGNFGSLARKAIPALIELQHSDKDAQVRSAAEEALKKINHETN